MSQQRRVEGSVSCGSAAAGGEPPDAKPECMTFAGISKPSQGGNTRDQIAAHYGKIQRVAYTVEDCGIFARQSGALNFAQSVGDDIDSRLMLELTCIREASIRPVKPIARKSIQRERSMRWLLRETEHMLMASYRAMARRAERE